MNLLEKRDYIQNNLYRIKEPAVNELYERLLSYLEDVLMEESEEEIAKDERTRKNLQKINKNTSSRSFKSLKKYLLSGIFWLRSVFTFHN